MNYIILLVFLVLVFLVLSRGCENMCSPFLYPDMYSPKYNCSDPFKWGFVYSTGRCPHTFDREFQPKAGTESREGSLPQKEKLTQQELTKKVFTHGYTHGSSGNGDDDRKHAKRVNYDYNYS